MNSKSVAQTSNYAVPVKLLTVRDVSAYLKVHPTRSTDC
jgi:hypothetical protein